MRFTKIPENTFQTLMLNAGVILKAFDPANPTSDFDENIVGATSGGVNFSAVPTFIDNGEDIDNCPPDTMELKDIEGWEVKMSGSLVTTNEATTKLLMAAADINTSNKKVTPRMDLKDADFCDLWFVCDYSNKNGDTNGGFVAIKVINALSTGGFSVQSTNRGKAKIAFEFTGHVSIKAQDVVPFDVYIQAGTDEAAAGGG